MADLTEFIKIYDSIEPTLKNIYHKFVKKTRLSDSEDCLNSLIDSSLALVSDIKEDGELNQEYRKIHEFFILTCIAFYSRYLNFEDDRLKEKQLGYQGYCEFIKSFDSVFGGNFSAAVDLKSSLESTLLSISRDIPYTEYIAEASYIDDVKNISSLLNDKIKKYGTKYKELLFEFEDAFNKNIDSALTVIKARYSDILAGTFGIDKYKGIYTGSAPMVMQGIKDGKASVLKPDVEFSSVYKPILDNIVDYKLCNELDVSSNGRQFDLKLIVKTLGENQYDAVSPIYFPFKILELTSLHIVKSDNGISFKNKTRLLNYSTSVFNGSLSEYLKVLLDFFEDNIMELIYIASMSYCENNFTKVSGSKSIDEKETRVLEILRGRTADIENGLGYNSLASYVANVINYYVSCVTTAVILDKLVVDTKKSKYGEHDNILDFRIKVAGKLKDETITNADFIAFLVASNNLKASDMADITETDSTYDVDNDNWHLKNFQYTFDSDKVNARPIFAYKALKELMAQSDDPSKSPLDWNNIMLGRTLSDSVLISGANGKINLQKNRSHFIYAGSRSGKGVMCYNIFSTAIASGLPLFYMDRKPDTATVMKSLSQDMYCVNGGQYEAGMDYLRSFNPADYHYVIPDYIANDFTETNFLNDYIYLRGLLLVFAMVAYADEYKESPIAKQIQSACSNGLLIIIDEYTNFQNGFTSRFYSNQGMLGKAKTVGKLVDTLKGMMQSKIASESKLNKASAKGDDVAIQAAQLDLNLKESEISQFNIAGLYYNALFTGYKTVLDTLSKQQNAGGDVFKKFHTFIIGQDLAPIGKCLTPQGEGTSKAAPLWFNLSGAARGDNMFISSKNIDPIIATLASFPSDVILGYQPDRPAYLAQYSNKETSNGGKTAMEGSTDTSIKSKTTSLLTASRRMFAYRSVGTLTSELVGKMTDTYKNCGNDLDKTNQELGNYTYFKPFLILNNGEEVPEGFRYKSDFEADPGSRASYRKGIFGDDEDPNNQPKIPLTAEQKEALIRSQYVGQCLTSCEDAGLTWDDLLNDNLSDDSTPDNKHLHSGIGFEGYIRMMAGGIPSDSMGASGKLANAFVQQVFGYQGTYIDFLCDLRPEWIITLSGIDKSTGVSDVKSRLASTFFDTSFCALNPAQLLGDKLGSLAQYYTSNASGNVDLDSSNLGVLEEEEEKEFDDIDEDIQDSNPSIEYTSQSSSQPTPTSSTRDTNRDLMYGDTESDSYEEDSYEEDSYEEDLYEEEQHGWSNEDRRKVAQSMVYAYLVGIKSADPVKASRLSAPQLRNQLVEMMYQLILNEGL